MEKRPLGFPKLHFLIQILRIQGNFLSKLLSKTLKVWQGSKGSFFIWPISLIAAIFLIAACQPQPNQVFIEVDGRRQALSTEAPTVRDVLDEAKVILEPLDKVSPDLYVQAQPGLVIVVTRVTEDTETYREVVPFERQTIVNEALNPGENRIAQLGVNGEVEITERIVYEDGQEVSRQEVSRMTIIEAAPEILVIGPQGELPTTTFAGTIAYLSNGNAWLMQESSGSRRALTTAGDLDGRVFDLAPNGRQLLYTRELTNEIELPLNELWLASTTIIGEEPTPLNVDGVLHAQWSPGQTSTLLAYSTAERVANPPGWRANNDLWLLDVSQTEPKSTQIFPANTQGLYPWWGLEFTWSPDGQYLAYARPDQIGIINVTLTSTLTLSDSLTALVDFVPLQTFSEWVWVPQISWSPDNNFIAATVHGPPLASEPPEESQVFDLWLFSIDGVIKAKVADQVGMWANPVWGAGGIAFGQAEIPLQSVNSRYTIQLIDRDGSNKRQLFPFLDGNGLQLPDLVWSPQGDQLLFADDGNLFLVNSGGSPPRQLTTDTQANHLQWVGGTVASQEATDTEVIEDSVSLATPAPITPSISLTTTTQLTDSLSITPSTTIEPEPTRTPLDLEDLIRGD